MLSYSVDGLDLAMSVVLLCRILLTYRYQVALVNVHNRRISLPYLRYGE